VRQLEDLSQDDYDDMDLSDADDVCEETSSKQGYQIAAARASAFVVEKRPMNHMLITMLGRSLTPLRVEKLVASFRKHGVCPAADWNMSVRAAWTRKDIPDPWIQEIMASPSWSLLTEEQQHRIQFRSEGCVWVINGNHRLRGAIVLSLTGDRRFIMDELHVNCVVYPETMAFVDAGHLSIMINVTENSTLLTLSCIDRFNIIGSLYHHMRTKKAEEKKMLGDMGASLLVPWERQGISTVELIAHAKAGGYSGINKEIVQTFHSLDKGNAVLFPMLDFMNYLGTVDAQSLRVEQAVCQ
jgi:hypothetical protein